MAAVKLLLLNVTMVRVELVRETKLEDGWKSSRTKGDCHRDLCTSRHDDACAVGDERSSDALSVVLRTERTCDCVGVPTEGAGRSSHKVNVDVVLELALQTWGGDEVDLELLQRWTSGKMEALSQA